MTSYCFTALSAGMVCHAAQTNWYNLKELYFSKNIEEEKGGGVRGEDPLKMGFLGCRVFFLRYGALIFFFAILIACNITLFSSTHLQKESELEKS